MWGKILLALFLILVLWILYTNDMSAQKSVADVRSRAAAMSETVGLTEAAPAPAVVAPEPAVVLPEAEKKEGFCPKLLQRHGFCNAGESMSNNTARGSVWDDRLNRGASAIGRLGREGLIGGDPASNTVWQGYMKSSVLPY